LALTQHEDPRPESVFSFPRCILITLIAVGILVSSDGIAQMRTPWTLASARILNDEGWNRVPEILSRIKAPVFPKRSFDVTTFGAKGDGKTDARPAITAAIAACASAGSGRVVIPPGEYVVNGPIHLQSYVNLHLEERAIIRFGTDPAMYTPLVLVRWEETLCYNYSPLIYARDAKNIALTGKGLIDGQTEGTWSQWREKATGGGLVQDADKTRLRQFGNDVTPVETRVFGNGFLDLNGDGKNDGQGTGRQHFLRPTLVQFIICENILIEGLSFKSAPFWTIHPVFCKNVTVRGVNIFEGILNDDGINPDSCTDVLIENCNISTRDDAIAIKAGRDQDAWKRPGTENVIIRNCMLRSMTNAFTIGSEMSGGVRNVYVENVFIHDAEHGINFKTNLDRGGQVENIYMRNIHMDEVQTAVFMFQMDYQGYRGNNFPTRFNDFFVRNLTCRLSQNHTFKIVGVEQEHIERIYLETISVLRSLNDDRIAFTRDIVADKVVVNGKPWSAPAGVMEE